MTDSMSEHEKNVIRLHNLNGVIHTNLYAKWDQSILIIWYDVEYRLSDEPHSNPKPEMFIFLDGEFNNPNFSGDLNDMSMDEQLKYRNSTNQLLQSLVLDPEVLQLTLAENRIFCDLTIYAMNRNNIENIKLHGVEGLFEGLELSIANPDGSICPTMGFHELTYDTVLNSF